MAKYHRLGPSVNATRRARGPCTDAARQVLSRREMASGRVPSAGHGRVCQSLDRLLPAGRDARARGGAGARRAVRASARQEPEARGRAPSRLPRGRRDPVARRPPRPRPHPTPATRAGPDGAGPCRERLPRSALLPRRGRGPVVPGHPVDLRALLRDRPDEHGGRDTTDRRRRRRPGGGVVRLQRRRNAGCPAGVARAAVRGRDHGGGQPRHRRVGRPAW